jgi:hypothetical protein
MRERAMWEGCIVEGSAGEGRINLRERAMWEETMWEGCIVEGSAGEGLAGDPACAESLGPFRTARAGAVHAGRVARHDTAQIRVVARLLFTGALAHPCCWGTPRVGTHRVFEGLGLCRVEPSPAHPFRTLQISCNGH